MADYALISEQTAIVDDNIGHSSESTLPQNGPNLDKHTLNDDIFLELGNSSDKQQSPPSLPPSIYFGGCAFGAAFYVGAFRALVDMYGPDFPDRTLLTGDSCGTIFAIGIALGRSPDELDGMYRSIASQSHVHGPMYNSYKNTGGSVFLGNVVWQLLENPHAYKLLEGRCWFGTTRYYSQHFWHKTWECNQDVFDAAEGSCHLPFYCNPNKKLGDFHVVDGAYSFAGTDLPHGDDTLYIGIDPHAEVTRLFTTSEMFFPSVGKQYEDISISGYNAMMAWDGTYKKKVGIRHPNWPALRVLWFLKFFETFCSWAICIILLISLILIILLACLIR